MKPKAENASKRIVKSINHGSCAHRVDFVTCPSCDHRLEVGQWDKAATVLVTDIVYGKHGYVAIVSECPKCFETSWVHHDLDLVVLQPGVWPASWIDAVKKEHTRRHVAAAAKFVDSLCARCVHLRRLEVDTIPLVDCTLGKDESPKASSARNFYMNRSFGETECSAFKARKTSVINLSETRK